MKKLSTIIMALALVLGMSQCKKQETPTTGNTTPTNPGVRITVNVGDKDGKDDNGEKHNIAPANGLFAFTEGDTLYVGYNHKYVGCLKYTNGFFDGTIYPDENIEDQRLHFYFLGGKGPKNPTSSTTTYNISIANQSTNLPVLSYGASNEDYTGPNTTYSATLRNQCALVRINLLTETTDAITLSNVPTQATVDFANNAITSNTSATGDITLYGEEGVETHRWAILLPGTNLSNSNCNVIWQGAGNMPAIGNNTYVNAGIGEGIQIQNQPAVTLPNEDLVIKNSSNVFSEFTVSSTGKKVYFSKANLKCNAANPNQLVWDFHDNQIDECPGFGAINSTSGTGTNGIHITSSNEMDRFSWGFHSPTTISEDDWVDGSRNLSRADGTDWGCALIGTGYGDNWRTLTAAEWEYLLNTRSGKRFLRANWKQPVYDGDGNFVKLVITNGIFIAPDGYTGSSYTEWNKTNKIHKFYGSGYINLVNELLNDGCVFLPALGYRQGSYYYEYNYHYSEDGWEMVGNYWTATGVEQQPGSSVTPQAKAFRFEDTYGNINSGHVATRNLGMCVRLVWDAN